ncbi:phospholipase YtpA [Clostridium tepidiprofundi DSM 19306]|uniref:Phospholipase YtpA n=1 Tax=Clostridium tepidiprofundi DSM 19306 TaxID=1121338 RepID=A0A151B437_9CLOT|nr:alpha/beta hydrolase [Clostridium tepidiprofundi]KYH34656.1 phospholipase YtpA [Clostridium tepidiprofundi DSM 19306]
MKESNFTFKDKMGQNIFVYKWEGNEGTPKAAIQIAHGASEHAKRYFEFAKTLTEEGFVVYANDHRGHGKTALNDEELGFFAEKNGWKIVVDDMHELTDIIKKENGDIPIFLLGHSMGSFLARSYIIEYGKGIDGVILSGTGYNTSFEIKLGLLISNREINKKGLKTKSMKLQKLTFGSLNNKFKSPRTDYDWLNRDEKEVDKYIEDKLCGGAFTTSSYRDLFNGISEICNLKNISKVPKTLPIYLFSGDKDPVGKNGKGVLKVYNLFKKAGIRDIEMKLYKDGRHEMLNELNKHEVYEDIINWINRHLK